MGAMCAEACAAGVDRITEEFLSSLAEADPKLARNDAAQAHAHECFTTECAMLEELQQ